MRHRDQIQSSFMWELVCVCVSDVYAFIMSFILSTICPFNLLVNMCECVVSQSTHRLESYMQEWWHRLRRHLGISKQNKWTIISDLGFFRRQYFRHVQLYINKSNACVMFAFARPPVCAENHLAVSLNA